MSAAASKDGKKRKGRGAGGGGGAGGNGGAGGGAAQGDAAAKYNEEEDLSNSSSEYQSDDEYAWIPWYVSLKGNEFLCEVDESYVRDGFNLTGLQSRIPYFEFALDVILDIEATDILSDDQQERVENDAEHLYGLIHARYILTNRGLHAMLEKYRSFDFGRCPRVSCRGQAVLPVGLVDHPTEFTVKLYCPLCEETYHCKSARHENMDGAYFGSTFPHLFFLTFPELKPKRSEESYVPRVFGFKVHHTAYKRSLEARKELQQRARDAEREGKEKATPSAAAGGTAKANETGGRAAADAGAGDNNSKKNDNSDGDKGGGKDKDGRKRGKK